MAFALLFLLSILVVFTPQASSSSIADNLWPLPLSFSEGSSTVALDERSFSFDLTSSRPSQILIDASQRYTRLMFAHSAISSSRPSSVSPAPTAFSISVSVLDVDVPLALGVDESFELHVINAKGGNITSATVWGAMHAMETLSQLVTYDPSSASFVIPSTPIAISDAPRFAWRGVLVDTARHFITVPMILHILDAMSYSRFNVMHWHMVDAQSWPLQLPSLPDFSRKGAFGPRAVYTQADVQLIIAHATARGIRVLPEVDVPGHAASWGAALPEIVAKCPSLSANINNIPLNPALQQTYDAVAAVFGDVAAMFPDAFVHTGGDEVELSCWLEDASVVKWMAANNFTTRGQVENYFESRLQPLLKAHDRSMVVWQELFNDGVALDDDVIVNVWIDLATLGRVVASGRRALLSAGFYLDKQRPLSDFNASVFHYEWVDTWIDFYNNEPTAAVDPADAHLVLGGEAAMWAEQVDDVNWDSRVWPRACAVAERLWSASSVVFDKNVTPARLEQHRCRLVRRGVRAGPVRVTQGEPCWW
jgi:hexosaminidase